MVHVFTSIDGDKVPAVLRWHSLPYSLVTRPLTEPGARLEARQPQRSPSPCPTAWSAAAWQRLAFPTGVGNPGFPSRCPVFLLFKYSLGTDPSLHSRLGHMLLPQLVRLCLCLFLKFPGEVLFSHGILS